MSLKPGLYIVSTPIGNLEDITFRAIKVLKNSNVILSEDTRITKRLIDKYEIFQKNSDMKLIEYNDHSNQKVFERVKGYIDSGLIVSLVSDAGTPCISDPGYTLISYLYDHNCYIDTLPGPCSPISALVLSALPPNRFTFLGFIPKTENSRRKLFEEFIDVKTTLIFFETGKRISDSLKVMYSVWGNLRISVVREITKIYQEVKRGALEELALFYEKNQLKGEIVIIVDNNNNLKENITDAHIIGEINRIKRLNYSTKDAVKIASERLSISKSRTYKLAVKHKS